jgi:hypothetical protein
MLPPSPSSEQQAAETSPAESLAKRDGSAHSDKLSAEDFYYEGAYLIFTAAYHLKRGYCCNSGCRHCPFGSSTS